ncbi:hypothetical protein EYF80_055346 [Liparis tanakae]|uniref:Uncharacterized protein n=1 Tax=Liparis tanakae TaxID=230148 RepID=A0A4Z2F0U7_9TELE|nr:hypothetical protein EYF80_055346 [Liparis tanakae]
MEPFNGRLPASSPSAFEEPSCGSSSPSPDAAALARPSSSSSSTRRAGVPRCVPYGGVFNQVPRSQMGKSTEADGSVVVFGARRVSPSSGEASGRRAGLRAESSSGICDVSSAR